MDGTSRSAWQTKSLGGWWRAISPDLSMQDWLWILKESTLVPDAHQCGSHDGPGRKPTDNLMASFLRRRPHKVCNWQRIWLSLQCITQVPNSLALSHGSGWLSHNCNSKLLTVVWSHWHCRRACVPMGGEYWYLKFQAVKLYWRNGFLMMESNEKCHTKKCYWTRLCECIQTVSLVNDVTEHNDFQSVEFQQTRLSNTDLHEG